METDEMELDTIGDRKTALFVIISDTDDTFNFVVSILYTQLFNLLCDKADDEYGGRLPVHVRCLLDEFANIGQIPKFEKLIATIRSREISASIILQSQSQLKAIYKDNADTITGTVSYWTTGTSAYVRSSFPIRFSASGSGLRYFPPTGCSMRSFTRPGTGRSVPSAARSLRQAPTASNTAPTAGSVSPADKPPSA